MKNTDIMKGIDLAFVFYSDQYDQKIPSLTFLLYYLEDDKSHNEPKRSQSDRYNLLSFKMAMNDEVS